MATLVVSGCEGENEEGNIELICEGSRLGFDYDPEDPTESTWFVVHSDGSSKSGLIKDIKDIKDLL